ncbi:cation:proton antiporter [Pseudomonas fulva]|uniref:cation:proton antiporter n=1 Tax=Pseudomonas fulva TaxID=47880 RepID=UPI0018AA9A29|nr:cation:proton antiporter [Pseudomonas fulva]MBF8774364.1 cation:proton antiporter [Pseudomonas fulva]
MDVVRALAELGLIMLMVEVPWHAAGGGKHPREQRASASIASCGIVLSFFLGCVVAAWSKASIAPTQPYWSYVIFCGVAVSVNALPVLVRIIQEHGGIDEQAGRLALSAAVYTDVFAWGALALVLTLHISGAAGPFESLFRLSGLAVYASLTVLVVCPWLRSRISHTAQSERSRFAITVFYCLLSAQVTAMPGLHQAIGAVTAAYVFHDLFSIEHAWRRWIGRSAHQFLTPIFFVCSGIQVSLSALNEPSVWQWLLWFLLRGKVGQVLGSYIGARIYGLKSINYSWDVDECESARGIAITCCRA